MIFLFLLPNVLFALFILFLTIAFVTGAPFVPSSKRTAQSMIDLARIKPGMKIYDLGSGEGRLLQLAAEKGATAIGHEINPFLVLFTKLRFVFSPYRKNIGVHWKNFWHSDFSDADVVFIYLLPWKMEKLEQLLVKQLKPGALIVSNSFIFPHRKIIRQDRLNHVYVFKI